MFYSAKDRTQAAKARIREVEAMEKRNSQQETSHMLDANSAEGVANGHVDTQHPPKRSNPARVDNLSQTVDGNDPIKERDRAMSDVAAEAGASRTPVGIIPSNDVIQSEEGDAEQVRSAVATAQSEIPAAARATRAETSNVVHTSQKKAVPGLVSGAGAGSPAKSHSTHKSCRLADKAAEEGRISEAVALYRDVLTVDGKHLGALLGLGALLLNLGELDGADNFLRRAAALRPDLAQTQYHLGMFCQHALRIPS